MHVPPRTGDGGVVTRDVGPARWVERWWRGEAGWPGAVLDWTMAPAELLFRGAVRFRGWLYDRRVLAVRRVGVPVGSVGNIGVGGTGKAPVVRWLVGELRRRGATPGVLHGGYAMDEPELHRRWYGELPVVANRDRFAGAARAIEAGATVLVLDDGFQHRKLHRDLDIVLVAVESWTGVPRLLPRGPWRESPAALARANVVAVTRKTAGFDDARRVAGELAGFAGHDRIVHLHIRPGRWVRWGTAGDGDAAPAEAIAVAGIARPDLFVENAAETGVHVSEVLVFPDHHDYGPEDWSRIQAAAAGKPVVTTEKDAVKLGPLANDTELWYLEQEVGVEAGAERLFEHLDALVT